MTALSSQSRANASNACERQDLLYRISHYGHCARRISIGKFWLEGPETR